MIPQPQVCLQPDPWRRVGAQAVGRPDLRHRDPAHAPVLRAHGRPQAADVRGAAVPHAADHGHRQLQLLQRPLRRPLPLPRRRSLVARGRERETARGKEDFAFLGARLQRIRGRRPLLPHRGLLLRLGHPRAKADVHAVILQPVRRAVQGPNSKELRKHFSISYGSKNGSRFLIDSVTCVKY